MDLQDRPNWTYYKRDDAELLLLFPGQDEDSLHYLHFILKKIQGFFRRKIMHC